MKTILTPSQFDIQPCHCFCTAKHYHVHQFGKPGYIGTKFRSKAAAGRQIRKAVNGQDITLLNSIS